MNSAHPRAESIARDFVESVSQQLPGLIEGVYLTGSAGTGDWREGRSDVDLAVIVSRPLEPRDATVLGRLHAQSREGSMVDGVYLTHAQLAAGPDDISSAPQSVDGVFAIAAPEAQLSWVTWLELESAPTLNAFTVTPTVSDTGTRASQASRANLLSYWRPLGKAAKLRSAHKLPGSPVAAEAVEWVTLGPPRLVVTAEQGRVVSKFEAGRFAAIEWPQFADLIDRVLAFRSTGIGEFTVADGRRALALLRAAVHRGSTV